MLLVLAFGAAVGGYRAEAVYAVHDSKVYAQIVEQISKVTQQIKEIQTQIDLQKQNMQDLVWSNIEPILSPIESARTSYDKLKKSTSKILQNTDDIEKTFSSTFETFEDLDSKDLTYKKMKSKLNQNRSQVKKVEREVMQLISAKQEELEASEDRISQYIKMLESAQGEKDTLQLQALIQAETVHSNNIQNEITSLRTKLAAIRGQHEKLEKDASDKMNEILANDFSSAADTAKTVADKQSKVTSLSPTFYELAESRGW